MPAYIALVSQMRRLMLFLHLSCEACREDTMHVEYGLCYVIKGLYIDDERTAARVKKSVSNENIRALILSSRKYPHANRVIGRPQLQPI